MNSSRYEKALADPSDVFDTPEDVLKAADLNKGQKIEILRRWEYNVSEEDVALEGACRETRAAFCAAFSSRLAA